MIDEGGGRGPANEAPSSICAFAGAVFVGTGQEYLSDDPRRRPPVGGEVLRLDDDGSVTAVVGDRRRVGSRRREPVSGLGPRLRLRRQWLRVGDGHPRRLPLHQR